MLSGGNLFIASLGPFRDTGRLDNVICLQQLRRCTPISFRLQTVFLLRHPVECDSLTQLSRRQARLILSRRLSMRDQLGLVSPENLVGLGVETRQHAFLEAVLTELGHQYGFIQVVQGKFERLFHARVVVSVDQVKDGTLYEVSADAAKSRHV